MSKVVTFAVNAKGRDFVVADIHGYFTVLERRLEEVGFDPDCDRVFALGDLIDRGDESLRALEFLAQPWFYTVLGNHEYMMIQAVRGGASEQALWLGNGGGWGLQVTAAERAQLVRWFCRLPLAIEVALADGRRIGLVHAELPRLADWRAVRSILAAIADDDGQLSRYPVMEMLWGRSQVRRGDVDRGLPPVKNIDHVFHGHTVVPEFVTAGNRTFMELGVFRSGRLGFVEPAVFLGKR